MPEMYQELTRFVVERKLGPVVDMAVRTYTGLAWCVIIWGTTVRFHLLKFAVFIHAFTHPQLKSTTGAVAFFV